MAIFSSKVSVQVPTESLWDYILGAEEQTRSSAPIIFGVDDPGELHLSAAEVAMHARRFAETLTALGVRPKDRILFVYPASIYSAAFFLAINLVGATFIPLSAEITLAELQVIFEHSKPSAIIFQPGGVDLGKELGVSSECALPLLLCLDSSTSLPKLYRHAPGDKIIERRSEPNVGAQSTRTASSPCLILYTSGTSGKPKGWMYSEETLLAGTVHLTHGRQPTKLTCTNSFGELRAGAEATAHDR